MPRELRYIIEDYSRLKKEYKQLLIEKGIHTTIPLHNQTELRVIIDNYKYLKAEVDALKVIGGEPPVEPIVDTIILDNDADYTIAQLITNTSLETFIAINTVVTGDVGTINLSSIEILNFGDQSGNALLVGDVGSLLLNNTTLTTLNITGGNTTYTAQTYSTVASGFDIVLVDTDWTNAEIDQLFNDLDAVKTFVDSIQIIGLNGYPTASSLTARDSLITAGVDINYNGIPITGFIYLNDTQIYNVGEVIDELTATLVPPEATAIFEAYNIPNGLSKGVAENDGNINGTTTTEDDYTLVVRATGYGDYSGVKEVQVPISVGAVASPSVSHFVNFYAGSSNAATGNWTNINGNALASNIIDGDGVATTIDANVSGFTSAETWLGDGGLGFGDYSDEVFISGLKLLIADNAGLVTFSDLDNGATYTLKVGISVSGTPTNRFGSFAFGGETQINIDPGLDQVLTFTSKSPTANVLELEVNVEVGSTETYVNFVELIKD